MRQIEPLSKGLEVEPRAKRSKVTDINDISSFLDSESAIWYRVNWRLLEEQFLFWYIWLKDHFEEMKEFVQEVKTAVGEEGEDGAQLRS